MVGVISTVVWKSKLFYRLCFPYDGSREVGAKKSKLTDSIFKETLVVGDLERRSLRFWTRYVTTRAIKVAATMTTSPAPAIL